MTKLGELLGTMADKLAQDSLNIGECTIGRLPRRHHRLYAAILHGHRLSERRQVRSNQQKALRRNHKLRQRGVGGRTECVDRHQLA